MAKTQPRPNRWNYFWNAVAIFVFLPLAIITVAEMSIRSKAKEYIHHKQNEIQQLLVNGVEPDNDQVGETSLSAYKSLSAKLSQALADLESLIVVGGDTGSDTARQIMRNALRQVSFFDQQATRKRLNDEKGDLQWEIEEQSQELAYLSANFNLIENAKSTIQPLVQQYKKDEDQQTKITIAKRILDELNTLDDSFYGANFSHDSEEIVDKLARDLRQILLEPKPVNPSNSSELISGGEASLIMNKIDSTIQLLEIRKRRLDTETDFTKDELEQISLTISELNNDFKLQNTTTTDQSCAFGTRAMRFVDSLRNLLRNDNPSVASQQNVTPCPALITALFPSDLLRATSVIASGAMGSFFLAFYFKNIGDISDRLAIGIIGGFVALLFLQGGKFLFVIEMDAGAQHNPFSGALVGFLAGLFTDKGFESLKTIADLAAKRVIDRHESQDDPLPELQGPPRPNLQTPATPETPKK